jgi:hypothetical protein
MVKSTARLDPGTGSSQQEFRIKTVEDDSKVTYYAFQAKENIKSSKE